MPFYTDKFGDIVSESDGDVQFSSTPWLPATPDYNSTTYTMPNERRHDMNFNTALDVEGTKTAGLRHQYILNADETEVYQLYDQFETEEHLVYYPFEASSSFPVYIVICGSHTASMFAEAIQLAQINPSNGIGNSYEDYASFEVAKQLPLSVHVNQVLCPSQLNQPIIMTGYSLGGVKSIYSHYYSSDVIKKQSSSSIAGGGG